MTQPRRPLRGYVRLAGILTEAAVCLTVVAVALRLVPFRRLAAYLGGHKRASPAQVDDATRDRARLVGRALRAARHRLPFQSRCLAMAIAGMVMLRRRRMGGMLYFGVANGGGDALKAHAWLRVGDVMVTGGAERHGHVVVSQFASASPGTSVQDVSPV